MTTCEECGDALNQCKECKEWVKNEKMYKFKVGDKVRYKNGKSVLTVSDVDNYNNRLMFKGCEGDYLQELYELVEDKPKYTVGRWYPNTGNITIEPNTIIHYLLTDGRELNHTVSDVFDAFGMRLPNSVAAFKIISYPSPPKKKVKKTIERWALYNIKDDYCHSSYSDEALAIRIAKYHSTKGYDFIVIKLTGEYEADED